MTESSVPNLNSGLDEFLTRLHTQRTARTNVETLFGGGGDSGSVSSRSNPAKVVKITQVASATQKWAIVKYVIIGVVIVAALGVVMYFVFNTQSGKSLKDSVQSALPLGDRPRKPPRNLEPANTQRLHVGDSPTPPPPPPIAHSVVSPYGTTRSSLTTPTSYPPNQPAPPQQAPPQQAPPQQAPQPVPSPAPQPVMKLVPRTETRPRPKPKPKIGNVGGLPGPL